MPMLGVVLCVWWLVIVCNITCNVHVAKFSVTNEFFKGIDVSYFVLELLQL